MSIGENIKKRCKELNITIKDLSFLSKIPLTTINDIVSNKSMPRVDKIKKIALTLHTTTDKLLFDEDDFNSEDEIRILFAEVINMPETEQRIVKETIKALILQNKSKELALASEKLKK